MGWNSWDFYGVSVNATILMNVAKAIASNGMAKAGYAYVNSDDAWMLATRDANYRQIANPEKFPDGFAAVTAYIHSLGLKSGLYTSRSPKTCAGFAASCDYEYIDTAQYAEWGIDAVKCDSCGSCRDVLADYAVMQEAIYATGRSMLLSVEGEPPIQNFSLGGHGQMRRVGHDITSNWKSAVSLVDIASGLWPYAHNASAPYADGSWMDLDMMEAGNGAFAPLPSGEPNPLSQMHMGMWCIMKAPLIIGTDILGMDAATLAILTNPDAIAINQDPLGVQARRVAVSLPKNNSLVNTDFDTTAVASLCSLNKPTQLWSFRNTSTGERDLLYLVPCASGDPFQQWTFAGAGGSSSSTMQNVGTGQCVDAAAQFDPGMLLSCNASSSSQQWILQPSSAHLVSTSPSHCLDVYMFSGPDVEMGSCKAPGDNDSNQQWVWDAASNQIRSNSSGAQGMCLSASAGPQGGQLMTTDAEGNVWCLDAGGQSEGGWAARPCESRPGGGGSSQLFSLTDGGNGVVLITGDPSPKVNNQFGASGPVPHSRYIFGESWDGVSSAPWIANLTALLSNGTVPTQIQAAATNLYDDDLVGNVTVGGDFCLDLTTMGLLEVWAGPLVGGKIAVALFNRSPGDDSITAQWADIGASSPAASYAVRDVWAGKDVGTFSGSYTSQVASHTMALLVLTPQ
jgi:alpha-galactosidase